MLLFFTFKASISLPDDHSGDMNYEPVESAFGLFVCLGRCRWFHVVTNIKYTHIISVKADLHWI